MTPLKKILIAVAVITAAPFAFNAYVSYSFQKSMMKTQLAMDKVPLACPPGAILNTERWGFLGFSRYCVVNELKNGPWEAWEGEYLQVKGGYKLQQGG